MKLVTCVVATLGQETIPRGPTFPYRNHRWLAPIDTPALDFALRLRNGYTWIARQLLSRTMGGNCGKARHFESGRRLG